MDVVYPPRTLDRFSSVDEVEEEGGMAMDVGRRVSDPSAYFRSIASRTLSLLIL